jgi:hypothetical protein
VNASNTTSILLIWSLGRQHHRAQLLDIFDRNVSPIGCCWCKLNIMLSGASADGDGCYPHRNILRDSRGWDTRLKLVLERLKANPLPDQRLTPGSLCEGMMRICLYEKKERKAN